eukprot:1047858-Amphidinium_carterae.1
MKHVCGRQLPMQLYHHIISMPIKWGCAGQNYSLQECTECALIRTDTTVPMHLCLHARSTFGVDQEGALDKPNGHITQ